MHFEAILNFRRFLKLSTINLAPRRGFCGIIRRNEAAFFIFEIHKKRGFDAGDNFGVFPRRKPFGGRQKVLFLLRGHPPESPDLFKLSKRPEAVSKRF